MNRARLVALAAIVIGVSPVVTDGAPDTCVEAKAAQSEYCKAVVAQARAQQQLLDAQRTAIASREQLDREKQNSDTITARATLATAIVALLGLALSFYNNRKTLILTSTANLETAKANQARADAELASHQLASGQAAREWDQLRDSQFLQMLDALHADSPRRRMAGISMMDIAAQYFSGVPMRAIVDQLCAAYVCEADPAVIRSLLEQFKRLYKYAVSPAEGADVARYALANLAYGLNDDFFALLAHRQASAAQRIRSVKATLNWQELNDTYATARMLAPLREALAAFRVPASASARAMSAQTNDLVAALAIESWKIAELGLLRRDIDANLHQAHAAAGDDDVAAAPTPAPA